MSNTNLDIEKISSNGLLSELSYLTLENEYFNYIISKNISDNKYSEKNIVEYLGATKTQINNVDKNYYWDKTLSFEEKTADDYRGIDSNRKEAILDILDKYEIKEFSSDPATGLQIMLLQDKQSGDYHIVPRGTADITVIKVYLVF